MDGWLAGFVMWLAVVAVVAGLLGSIVLILVLLFIENWR